MKGSVPSWPVGTVMMATSKAAEDVFELEEPTYVRVGLRWGMVRS